jgi:hypothetical protein
LAQAQTMPPDGPQLSVVLSVRLARLVQLRALVFVSSAHLAATVRALASQTANPVASVATAQQLVCHSWSCLVLCVCIWMHVCVCACACVRIV